MNGTPSARSILWLAFTLIFILPATSWARTGPAGRVDKRTSERVLELKPHRQPAPEQDIVRRWNRIATDADATDHALYLEQLGPPRASRALAITHIAMFDAVNAVKGGYQGYTGIDAALPGSSMEAAVAQAAHDSLTALYPSQSGSFDAYLEEDLAAIQDPAALLGGMDAGARAAAAILALREADGSQRDDPPAEDFESAVLGEWRRDPVSQNPIALGAYWPEVAPFVLGAGDQFRIPPPPALASPEYAQAYQEVKDFGGVGAPVTPTLRSLDQMFSGIFWSYNGTPFLGTPPRLFNQIAVHIADQMHTGPADLARLLALINVSLADTAIAVWDSKYFYSYWRPVHGIRAGDLDGNPLTEPDAGFVPLGGQASNLPNAPDFSPPFPAYPSGHAGFGSAMFQILRHFYGTDAITFTFVSDELSGETLDFAPPYPPLTPAPPGEVGSLRPRLPRSFASLSEAEAENAQGRIYLGVHWQFDATQGIAQGRQVADFVFSNTFLPASSPTFDQPQRRHRWSGSQRSSFRFDSGGRRGRP